MTISIFQSVTLDKSIETKIFKKEVVTKVTKIGTIFCMTKKGISCQITNVLYSEDFPDNFLSIRQFK